MPFEIQIRRWRQAGFCGLFCLIVCAGATSQTNAPAPSAPAATHIATPVASPETAHHAATKHTSSKNKKKSSRNKSGKKRGQQAIDATRATQIQTALIREHYLQGEPSGKWDATTQAAMQKYQADHGWQSKTTPDSRALIKLGLGPSSDHLLNPESAMTTAPATGDPKSPAKQAAGKPATDQNLPKQ
jgi:peptidoglycan hydrolase-like protein with peptidoglycan-binding domain